jgi:NAD(P)-dependent dehydrogenase (short-subunit alcohol dehydrogenase family)
VVELALARHDRIDHVVNSAADVAFHGSMLEATHKAERLAKQLLLNSLAPALIASEVARTFWRDRPAENRRIGRSVVNLASISGLKVFAGTGQAGYSASKAALLFLSCHMATEFEYIGVRVNALAPARFPDTISTESVTDTVARILSGKANGKIFTIDQGGVRTVN